MAVLETGTCRFPGCDRPVEPAGETVGRPPRYCDLPEHNAQTAFRERRRRAAGGERDGDQRGGERPALYPLRMEPRLTRWQKARKDWLGFQWRDLIPSAIGLGIAILVLEESNFSGSTVAEVGIVGACAIAAGLLYAVAQLAWAWRQAPMRLLTEDVVAIRKTLEARPSQTPISLPRAVNDYIRRGRSLLMMPEFSEQDALSWANAIGSTLSEHGSYEDTAQFSLVQGEGEGGVYGTLHRLSQNGCCAWVVDDALRARPAVAWSADGAGLPSTVGARRSG
ncbi:MAG: hypothetical protein ABSG43_21140 [Solirubrobacteraceae bacterium]|jgi:hypothetical protein